MSPSSYQLAVDHAPLLARGAFFSAVAFQALFVLTTFHIYRGLKKDVTPRVKIAQIAAVLSLLMSVGVMEGQPFTYWFFGIAPGWERMRVVKDAFLVLYAVSVINLLEYLHVRVRYIPRGYWWVGAAVAASSSVLFYFEGIMKVPNVVLMAYCCAAFFYVALSYRRLSMSSTTSLSYLRYLTISLGYVLMVAFSFLRTWQTPALPEATRLGLAVLNRLIILGSIFTVYLGFAMPRWFESFGVGLVDLFSSRRYLDRIRRFYALMYDLSRNVSDPQRSGLAELSCKAAESLGGDCSVTWDVALLSPIHFKRYKGDGEVHPRPPSPYSLGPQRDLRHFALVYDALTPLLAPTVPPDAPVEAKVVRAASLFLDQYPERVIVEETSPEIVEAVKRASEKRSCDEA